MTVLKRLFPVTFLIGVLALSWSCKRDDVEAIGPEVAIASANFKIDGFTSNKSSVNFRTDTAWFLADFNERVSWELKVTGLTSKAEKIIKGTSDSLHRAVTNWTGGHSGLYFFKAGEKAVAEFKVFGSEKVWYDTLTISGEKSTYGDDVIVWWDMNTAGKAVNGSSAYWFDFFDNENGVSEKIKGILEVEATPIEPVQGVYRSIEGQDGLGPSAYFVGAASHTPVANGLTFTGDLKDVYVNFYLRARTATSGMSFDLISGVSDATHSQSTISHEVGVIDWDGWKLISVNLGDMNKSMIGTEPFTISGLNSIRLNMQVTSGPDVDRTGFDIDFIVFTKGAPFNPDNY